NADGCSNLGAMASFSQVFQHQVATQREADQGDTITGKTTVQLADHLMQVVAAARMIEVPGLASARSGTTQIQPQNRIAGPQQMAGGDTDIDAVHAAGQAMDQDHEWLCAS